MHFIFLTDICSLCWQKCEPGPKLFPRQDIFSTFSGVHTLNFIGPHEEPSNFYGEKRSVAFVTSHLFTFLVVLSLVCLVTTQILICENQTIWRLEILLRTIVTALLKTKDISVTPVVIIALSWLAAESKACDMFKSTECRNVWYLDKIFLEPKAFEPSSWRNCCSVEPSFFAFFFQPVSDHSNYVSA